MSTLNIFIHYHILFDESEPLSQVSNEILQAEHDQLNADFSLTNGDRNQVPNSTADSRYDFASQIGNPDIQFLPIILQPSNITRSNFTGMREPAASPEKPYYYNDMFKKASPLKPGFLNVYIFPKRVANQVNFYGWASQGDVRAHVAWPVFGANTAQRGTLTHEIGHLFGLTHTFKGQPGRGNCTLIFSDVPVSSNTNWLNQKYRKNDPCLPPDIPGGAWTGICDNVAVDKALLEERPNELPNEFPFSCSNVQQNPTTSEHENFFNFMDYSNFRRMFSVSQANIMRQTAQRNSALFSGSAPQQATPPNVQGVSQPVRFLLPYRLVHSSTNNRLALITLGVENVTLARTVPPGDPNEAVIFINETDELFANSKTVIESTILTINHFASGARLALAIENSAAKTLTFEQTIDLGDQTGFFLRTNEALEPITTTTPFVLSQGGLQVNVDKGNVNAVVMGPNSEYWHLEPVQSIERPAFPAAVTSANFPQDEPPRPIRYGERYRIASVTTGLEWNATDSFFLTWAAGPGAAFILQETAVGGGTSAQQDQNQEFIEHQGLALLRLPNTREEVQVNTNFLSKTVPGKGSTLFVDAASTAGPIHTNTPVRLQFPIVPGFRFVNHNVQINNAIELTEATDFLVRFLPEDGLQGQTPVVNTPVEEAAIDTGLRFNDLAFIESTNPSSNELDRIGFSESGIGWVNSDYIPELNSPFQMRILPVEGSGKQLEDPLFTNDTFILSYEAFPTFATRNESGQFWFTGDLATAGTFKLIGSVLGDLRLIFNDTFWLGRSQDGTATLTPTESLRAQRVNFVVIDDPIEPPMIENPPPTGLQFHDTFNIASPDNPDQSFGFVTAGDGFGYTTDVTQQFVFKIIGLDDLQTGSVNVTTPFLLRFIGYQSFFQIGPWYTFDKAEASPLVLLSTDATNTRFFLADANDRTRRLTFFNNTSPLLAGFGPETEQQSYTVFVNTPVAIDHAVPPVEPPQPIPGVPILFNRPYQLLRSDIDGSSLELATAPLLETGNFVQWAPRGNGHAIVFSAIGASGPIGHETAVFVNHVVTDSSLVAFADDNPFFWAQPMQGDVFRVETKDQQPLTCESRCRLRKFPFDDPPTYLNWARVEGLDVCVTRNDPSYSLAVSCMDDAVAYESAPTEEQRLAAREHNKQAARTAAQQRLPSEFRNVVGARQLTAQGSTLLSFREYSRITHTASGRLLTSGTGEGLQFLPPEIANERESIYAFEKEDTNGVLSQGDNAWIISTVFQNKAFAVGVDPGALFFFATPATGTKLRVEGPEPGEAIRTDTPLRFRLVFPNSNLRQDLFMVYDAASTQAIIGEDDSFQFTIADFNLVNDPVPIHDTIPITYQTAMRIIDRQTAIIPSLADELAAGGGSFGLYFAPTRHGTSIFFQPAADLEDTEERPIKHGDQVLIVHTIAERQVTFDPNQENRLDFVSGIGDGLVFEIEAEQPSPDNELRLGDSYRIRETTTQQYLTRDPLTGTIVLAADPRFTLGVVTTDVVAERFITAPTGVPGNDGDNKPWYELWWIWAIIAGALLLITLLAIFIPRLLKTRKKSSSSSPTKRQQRGSTTSSQRKIPTQQRPQQRSPSIQ